MVDGHVRVKISEDFASLLETQADSTGAIVQTSVKSSDDILSSIGVKYMSRTFPDAGRFEARSRAEGLHLWYDVYFDTLVPLTRANSDLSTISGIDVVEYRPKIVHLKGELVERIDKNSVSTYSSRVSNSESTTIFNDPMLGDQWHYYNDGTKGVEGCDINVIPAWEYYTKGSSDVIVSVVDGGIDVTHPDLIENLWVSEDGNNGWNFYRNSKYVTADDHGTHVAGVIGAVNNNGIGICGIAGGDLLNGIGGVKLMSCQIFEGDYSASDAGIASAIKYGADNGAVISQNSWGYEEYIELPASDKDAIDYFIQFAGLDENGVQAGPMAGGIVIFAAGNETSKLSTIGSYEEVISVAAVGADYKIAYYSNYGSWVSISATGGDYYKNSLILSTISNGEYGYMQGTSMACPHVSGVAALLISKFGGPGFTPDILKTKLLGSARDLDEYNSGYANSLGAGLVDAYASLATGSLIAPNAVAYFTGSSNSNTISLEWGVPADADDYKASSFTLYYSTNSFTSSLDRDNLPNGISTTLFSVGDLNVGDIMSEDITDLEFDTEYYFAIEANDISKNKSELSEVISITTKANNAPVINAVNGSNVEINAHSTSSLVFNYSDIDNHTLTWSFESGSNAATATSVSAGEIVVKITGSNAQAGSYEAKIVVTDSYGLFTEQIINYTILPNHAPTIIKNINNIVMGAKGEQLIFNLNEIFNDEDGEVLSYTIESTSAFVAQLTPVDSILTITAMSFGSTDITLIAKDGLGEQVSITFKILVRDETQEIDIYPSPVVDTLYLRMSEEVSAEVTVFGTSGATMVSGNYNISPFNPAQVNMSNLSAGSYVVVVKYGNNELTRNIIKL